jgi:uncharacterized SAM-dependent methyltransferase
MLFFHVNKNTDVTANFDVNHFEFEAQYDASHEAYIIEDQLEEIITERRATVQQI